jgi:hypothetical protein
MKASTAQGPVLGPALGVSPTRASDATANRIRPRRQIGTGARSIINTCPVRGPRRRADPPPKRGRSMNRVTFYITAAFALLLSVVALGIGAAVDSPRTLMSRADYSQGRKAIDAEARIAYARCRSDTGSAREICKAEAKAALRVQLADLQARYYGTVAAAEDARVARAKGHFEVAKARCAASSRDARDDCLQSARADRSREMAEAKLAST